MEITHKLSSLLTNFFLFFISRGFLKERKIKLAIHLLYRNQKIRRMELTKINRETKKVGKKEAEIKPKANSIFKKPNILPS